MRQRRFLIRRFKGCSHAFSVLGLNSFNKHKIADSGVPSKGWISILESTKPSFEVALILLVTCAL